MKKSKNEKKKKIIDAPCVDSILHVVSGGFVSQMYNVCGSVKDGVFAKQSRGRGYDTPMAFTLT